MMQEVSQQQFNEVSKQIRLGLWFGEISNEIHKNKLDDWFIRLSIKKPIEWVGDCTESQLQYIAECSGLTILQTA